MGHNLLIEKNQKIQNWMIGLEEMQINELMMTKKDHVSLTFIERKVDIVIYCDKPRRLLTLFYSSSFRITTVMPFVNLVHISLYKYMSVFLYPEWLVMMFSDCWLNVKRIQKYKILWMQNVMFLSCHLKVKKASHTKDTWIKLYILHIFVHFDYKTVWY